ncbi:DEAD/DEAH box helicase [Streptosporangium sp. NPDC049304]|uniref:DEAD/DEAH box helicase n=1 Tax=Streptosporangium sp. NPDC049304 TaxID=3154830 RepID=UPI003449498B
MSDPAPLHPTLVHHLVNTLGWPSLRPLQQQALGPLASGQDALLLAPTAGGKTEAAAFPLLSAMAAQHWTGISILYVCPIKALLNNLLPRLERYAEWLGRRVALWHGDVTSSRRAAILRDPPDILLTTPESLESMLVSTKVDHPVIFAGLRAVVVDEVHAFAGDDRGWHLLCVLERLTRIAGRPIQRVGLSATVGNPTELLAWLQGSSRGNRTGEVISPSGEPSGNSPDSIAPSPPTHDPSASFGPSSSPPTCHDSLSVPPGGSPALADPFGGSPGGPPPGDVELDHVGSVANAAKVIAALHRGEKRLVFCDSRQLVEELGTRLRTLGVTVFLSHASLSVEERRRAEHAFGEGRDCVIVATSTLELGIDVGDLDRVIQIDAPSTVASFLQRVGRTGRRPGSTRNCLFLALDEQGLLRASGLLRLWGRHWVEPVTPPPEPRHIVAQQFLALCLQEYRIGDRTWPEWWPGLEPFGAEAAPILRHLVSAGFVDTDGGMLFIGPAAEKAFGHRHFMELTTVFTASPQFTVLHGRAEIGRVDPSLLCDHREGPRLLLLAGRSWQVTWIDWRRRRCFVEAAEHGGRARWQSGGLPRGTSFQLMQAIREVLLGATPPVRLTHRAVDALAGARERHLDVVHPGGSVIVRGDDVRWWTWAGYRANLTLRSTLASVADPKQQVTDAWLRLRTDVSKESWTSALRDSAEGLCLPEPDPGALEGLKFNTALPARLAERTLAARLADFDGARAILNQRHRFSVSSG